LRRRSESKKLSKTCINLLRDGITNFVVIKGAVEIGSHVGTSGGFLLRQNLHHSLSDDAPLTALLATDPLN
jgi:hypothetical protein